MHSNTDSKTETVQMTKTEYDNLRKMIARYTTNLDKISEYTTQIKQLKEENKNYYEQINNIMKINEISELSTETYDIKMKEKQKKKPLNDDLVRNTLIDLSKIYNPSDSKISSEMKKIIQSDQFINELIEMINQKRIGDKTSDIKFIKKKQKKK